MKYLRATVGGPKDRVGSVVISWICATALISFCSPARAHHSFAMYDGQKSITVKGTVKSFNYGNPHTLIVIVITDAAGEIKDFTIETNGAFNLARNHGWNREILKPGDVISALVSPLRDGSLGGDLYKITLPDGRELIARPPPYPPEEKK